MSNPMFHPALYVLLLASLSGDRAPAQALADWELQGRADGLARPDTPCQDFLQAMGRKPAGLEYVGCTQDDVSYIKPMQAHYRVAGARAGRSVSAHDVRNAEVTLHLLWLEQWRALQLARRSRHGEVPDRDGGGIAAASAQRLAPHRSIQRHRGGDAAEPVAWMRQAHACSRMRAGIPAKELR